MLSNWMIGLAGITLSRNKKGDPEAASIDELSQLEIMAHVQSKMDVLANQLPHHTF